MKISINQLREMVQEEISRMNEKKKPSAGLSAKQRSAIAKKASSGKNVGKPGKNFDKVASNAAKRYGSAEAGKRVAAAAMWKNAKR